MTQRGAELGVAEDVLDDGAVSVPVLDRGRAVSPVETSRLVTMNE